MDGRWNLRRWLAWLVGAAAMALLGAAFEATNAAETPGVIRPTVAVLPFENQSGIARQAFFAAVMTDEIAAALTAVRGLSVVARSSSFQLEPRLSFSSTPAEQVREELGKAGAALNARYLVQGGARIVETTEHAQLNIRLVRSSDGAELWSRDYDVDPAGVFDLEEDIAREIADVLKVPTVPDTLVGDRIEPFAYLDYLRAKVAARPRGAQRTLGRTVLCWQSRCGLMLRRVAARPQRS
jgi:TolB-like protein